MNGLSVLTIVRGREAHLVQLVEGLRRSCEQPDELVVVVMGDQLLSPIHAGFRVRIEHMAGEGLQLAAARNRAASLAQGGVLVFLDVDCIPLSNCLTRLRDVIEQHDALVCAEALYLGPNDARGAWTEAELLCKGRRHPARVFPTQGVRNADHPGLFWSLAFGIRHSTFDSLGGFDEGYIGYGAEDTDFGYRASSVGLPILFVGGALVCHQHHASHEPPVQHLNDIIRNACRYHARWNHWPMEGWLKAFEKLELITWTKTSLVPRRYVTSNDFHKTEVLWPVSKCPSGKTGD